MIPLSLFIIFLLNTVRLGTAAPASLDEEIPHVDQKNEHSTRMTSPPPSRGFSFVPLNGDHSPMSTLPPSKASNQGRTLRKSLELGEETTTITTTTVAIRKRKPKGEIDIPSDTKSTNRTPTTTTTKAKDPLLDELVPKDENGMGVVGPSKQIDHVPIPLDPGARRGATGQSGDELDVPVDTNPRRKVDECYSGFSIVNGETVATGTERCPNIGDLCYNATVSGPLLPRQIGKAGCSTTRCSLAGAVNKCVNIEYLGYKINFCCCDGFNLCNSKYTNLNVIEAGIEKIKDGFKFVDKILDVVG